MKDYLNNIQWLVRLEKIFSSQDISELEKDLYEKLDLLVFLHEVLADKKIKLLDNETFLESLVIKFYLHGITIYSISKGYNVTSKYLNKEDLSKHTFLDISSLLTVGRAQMECLLMYQHIYVNDKNHEEQNLRYYSWIYTALIQRVTIPNYENVGEDKLKQTLIDIQVFKEKIQNCPAYQNLTEKQRNGLLEKGSAKLFRTWDKVFKDCKFSKKGMFEKFYYILSAYAHSEGLSGLQLKHNKYFTTSVGNKSWQFTQLITSWFMTGIMIENIVDRFPDIKKIYEQVDLKTKYEVSFLSRVAKFEEPIA